MTRLSLPDKALARAVQSLPDDSLSATRHAALARFLERGFPTTRLEDWKYTDLKEVAEISRRWLEAGAIVADTSALDSEIQRICSSIDADWIVVANGVISPAGKSRPDNGITVSTYSESSLAPAFEDPLADFNAALLTDGLHIRFTAAAASDRPLGLLIIDGTEGHPGVAQTRIRIEFDEGAKAQLIEYQVSLGEADHYANAIVELSIGSQADVDYVRVQKRAESHNQTHRTEARLGTRSVFRYSGFDLGGQLIRNDLDIEISAPDAEVSIAGLYVAGDGQHIDNHVRIDHRTGPARSTQEYRGILGGQCRCVWNGKAIVRPGADGTDAEQANHNLLLSDRSEIDAKPELEIYADDVKCSHGTTVGQIDDSALFYLRTRGLDRKDAIRALTRAFGASIVSRLRITELAESLTAMVEARLGELTESDS
jgi:Fe-S cluster assembly protein SufD